MDPSTRKASVQRDETEALAWYHKAAEQGNTEGQWKLGLIYEEGRGVPQDYVEAHMWLNLAVSRSTGEEREQSVLERDYVEAVMAPEQLAEAQRRAREWDAAHPR